MQLPRSLLKWYCIRSGMSRHIPQFTHPHPNIMVLEQAMHEGRKEWPAVCLPDAEVDSLVARMDEAEVGQCLSSLLCLLCLGREQGNIQLIER